MVLILYSKKDPHKNSFCHQDQGTYPLFPDNHSSPNLFYNKYIDLH